MSEDKQIYVIDTNVLVDYIDIIPPLSGSVTPPEEPTVDLSQAHIVIPTVVIRELSNFKKEKSERGKAARVALKRIRGIVEHTLNTMDEVYNLDAAVDLVAGGGQTLSVLPVHKDFKKALPFSPSDRDMDGQIILTALVAAFIEAGLPVDGTAPESAVVDLQPKNVVLLTNDNGLAIRARERGLKTSRYGYKYPEPYTGRRDIVVPKELFCELYNSGLVERAYFEEMMPKERKLVANEFIVMSLANPRDYPVDFDPEKNPYFENVGRYDEREDAIVRLKYATSFPVWPRNPGQAIYAEALMDPDIAAVICTGPAGSGKTYMSTVFGYKACLEGRYIGVTAVPCESHSDIGALPGDLDEKMDPDVQPLKNALRNYLLNKEPRYAKDLERLRKFGAGGAENGKKNGKKKRAEDESDEPHEKTSGKTSIKTRLHDQVEMIWGNWFESVPIENARGRDFAYQLAIYDEFQDQNAKQADTLVKRIGTDGKIVLTGDIWQIHAAYLDQSNNGLVYASQLLFDNPMVAQVCFTDDEVIRHPLVRMIAERQEAERAKRMRPSETSE